MSTPMFAMMRETRRPSTHHEVQDQHQSQGVVTASNHSSAFVTHLNIGNLSFGQASEQSFVLVTR